MAGKFINKFLDVIGLGYNSDDVDEEQEIDAGEDEQIEVIPSQRKGKVVNIHEGSSARVVVAQPSEFEQITTICDALKSRKICIINLQELDAPVAQRLLDFAGGASYALGGSIQEVSPKVYLITPDSVEVSSDFKDEMENRGIFSWTGK